MIFLKEIGFDHSIEIRETWNGKWIYILHLQQIHSRPSRKFSSREAAIADAEQMLQFMA